MKERPGVVSIRSGLVPLILGAVTSTKQVALFKIAQAPQSGFLALSAPARMVLLTEQTRDWERGRPGVVIAALRRYVLGTTLLMAVLLPPIEWAMPTFVRLLLGSRYLPATDAARLVLGAAAIQLVFGWTKSFAVTIGRPGLRERGRCSQTHCRGNISRTCYWRQYCLAVQH